MTPWTRAQIAGRVAVDIPDGSYVNLGVGIPTLVADHLPAGREVVFHSENGLLGVGAAPAPGEGDPDVINAGKQQVTLVRGGCYMAHADSFALIRGGHLDIAVLGGFEVSGAGDLANWSGDGETVPAVGGAMDLAVGAREVWVAMTHTGTSARPKLVEHCRLPLTAPGVVTRVYTDLAVLHVDREARCFVVEDLVPGLTIEQLQSRTGAPLRGGRDLTAGGGTRVRRRTF
jgi:3-oxoadipate CoA-transferase beta subunit